MNPRHFWSNPADIWIRINPEIQIRIPGLLLVDISILVEFALSEYSLNARL